MKAGIPQQGWNQQSPANQAIIAGGQRATSYAPRRKRARKSKTATKVKRTARKAAKRAGRMVLKKGSAAAKAYMAKIRRMRKR